MLKDENFIALQGWMINKLKLSGNSLIVYAVIYGFSQDGNSHFSGSASYLADICSCSKNCIYSVLKKLTEKGLLEKKEKITNGVKLCDYRTTNLAMVHKKVVGGTQKSCVGGTQKSCYHNIDIDNIDKDIEYNNVAKATNPVSKKSVDKTSLELAKKMLNLHKQIDPVFSRTPKQLEAWASDIEKLHRIDKRDYEGIESVIEWAKEPTCFWACNIISGKKLREKFPTLVSQMLRAAPKHNNGEMQYAGDFEICT